MRVSTAPIHFETCLFKFNSELEYDSIYTMPMVYDTVCGSPIASDTIPLDCWPVYVDEPPETMDADNLQIAPNPAQTRVSVTIPGSFSVTTKKNGLIVTKVRPTRDMKLVLSVYDQLGKQIVDTPVHPNENEISLEITSWSEGIYFLSLSGDGMVIGNGKLVVSR